MCIEVADNLSGDQVSATHVSDLQKYSEEELVTLFGQKIGNLLHK